jgi:hypothetical protein
MRDRDAKEQFPDVQLPDVQLEALLDSLLSKYSAAEPRPGLDKRILANLHQAAVPKLRFWMQPWLLGAAAALAASVLVLAFLRPAQPSHFAPIQARKRETSPQKTDVSVSLPVRRRAGAQSEPAGTIIRKLNEEAQGMPLSDRPAIFPTPMPLSEQEGFMFLYLANTPKEELIAQGHREEEKDDGFWDDSSLSSPAPQPSGHIR